MLKKGADIPRESTAAFYMKGNVIVQYGCRVNNIAGVQTIELQYAYPSFH